MQKSETIRRRNLQHLIAGMLLLSSSSWLCGNRCACSYYRSTRKSSIAQRQLCAVCLQLQPAGGGVCGGRCGGSVRFRELLGFPAA